MSDFVVYTAITPGYDALASPPPLWQRAADFVAFTDGLRSAPGWAVRPLYRRFRDPCRNAKIHKLLPHEYFPKAEYSLWLDGSILITATLPLAQWADAYLREHDLAVFKHPNRTCIYEEAMYCLRRKLDRRDLIDRQMQQYFEDGYPPKNGLAECTILLRRHTPAIRRFNEAWYAEIKAHSRRDQLSFNYVARKLGLHYAFLPGTVSNNPHFFRRRHLGPRSRPR
jgi:hypothetical protein